MASKLSNTGTDDHSKQRNKIPVQVEYGSSVYTVLVNEDMRNKLNSSNMAERNSTRNNLIEFVKKLKSKELVMNVNEESHESEDEETLTYCNKCKEMVGREHQCEASKSMESQTDHDDAATFKNEEQKGSSSVWLKAPTLELIEHYLKFKEKINSGLMTKKVAWDQISCQMKSNGYDFTSDQIQGRWKSLTRAYKNVKDHNNKSGNNLKHYEYEKELDKVFGDDPLIVPKLVASSLKRKKISLDDLEKKAR